MTKVELYLNKPEYSLGDKVQGTFKISYDGWFDKPVEVKPFLSLRGRSFYSYRKKNCYYYGNGRPSSYGRTRNYTYC